MFFLGLLSEILPAWAWLSNKIWWTYAARQHCLRKNVLDTVTNASTAVSFPKRETVFTVTIVKKSWHMFRFSYPIYSTVSFNLFKIPCLPACNLFCSQLHESTVTSSSAFLLKAAGNPPVKEVSINLCAHLAAVWFSTNTTLIHKNSHLCRANMLRLKMHPHFSSHTMLIQSSIFF